MEKRLYRSQSNRMIFGVCGGLAKYREGGYHVSRNFESAENRIDIELECNIGRVEVR